MTVSLAHRTRAMHNHGTRRPALVALALLLSGCSTMTPQDAQLAWHAQRLAELRTSDGWLTLVGLDFLPEGASTIGSCGSATFAYPNCADPIVGTFERDGDRVRFTPAGASESTLLTADDQGSPSVIQSGSVSFTLVRRSQKPALRVRDRESPVRANFEGIALLPYDPAFVVNARVTVPSSPEEVEITNVLGFTERQRVAAILEFELLGAKQSLVATDGSHGQLFVVFGDPTNGTQTYGGGRFMNIPAPVGGSVEIDFNRAYNPPCSFTPFATCPLPPTSNRLRCSISVGEQATSSHG